MTSFSEITPEEIREDCRYYSGYKPCGKHDGCPECPEYAPRGTEILVIKLGAMGDVLRTKCLLPGLKRAHPQSWITWLTAPGSEPIVRDPLVDEVRTLTPEGLLALEGRSFGLLLCLDKEAPALALARQLSAERKLGYAPTPFNTLTVYNEGAHHALRMGLSDELKFYRNTLTHQEVLYRMAELEYRGDEYRLTVSPAAHERAAAQLAGIGIDGAQPVVGLNTGCGPVFQTKQYPPEHFAELARRLIRGTDATVLLLGGPREKPLHDRIRELVGTESAGRLLDAGTENPLEDFFGIVARTDVVVTADSLGMHVAIALQREVVAFFGPTCHQEVDLFERGEKLVTDYDCSPCYLKQCDVRPSCMQAMTADEVEPAIRRALERARKARRRELPV